MMSPDQVERLVQGVMPDATVSVSDMTGTSDHFSVLVVSESFRGKSLIERHRMMHRIFETYLAGPIHAVKYKTLTPEEAAR
jgi:stress-induced morphogen